MLSQDPSVQRRSEEIAQLLHAMLALRYPYLKGRDARMQAACSILAKELKIPQSQQAGLYVAARYHDVGMLALPERLVLEERNLSPAEQALVRAHTVVGSRLLARLFPEFPEAARAAAFHHEQPDGKGLHGLKSADIPDSAAILAIAGAAESMINGRPHRPPLAREQVLDEIRKGTGIQFTQAASRAFLDVADDVLEALKSKAIMAPVASASASHSSAIPPVPAAAAIPPSLSVKPTLPQAVPQASAELRMLLPEGEAERRVEAAIKERAPSLVTARVISMAASPHVELSDLASVLSTDPVLSARVLQVANSSAYAGNRRVVTTIPDAVRQIGSSTVRNIALSLGVMDAIPTSAGFDIYRYWQHSLAVARLCELMMGDVEPQSTGPAYLMGLCHELGIMLFHSLFGSEYRQVLQAHVQSGERLEVLERQMLGLTHRQLIQRIFRSLSLPDLLRLPIENLFSIGTEKRQDLMSQILRLADVQASGLLLAPSSSALLYPVTQIQCKCLGSKQLPQLDTANFTSEILALTATLARISDADQRRLAEPLISRLEAKIWVALDPTFSKGEPISSTLSQCCEVQIEPRLPQPSEIAEMEGLVIIARSENAPFGAGEINALANSGLPALWLAARSDQALPPSMVHPQALPISIKALGEFVCGITKRDGSRSNGMSKAA